MRPACPALASALLRSMPDMAWSHARACGEPSPRPGLLLGGRAGAAGRRAAPAPSPATLPAPPPAEFEHFWCSRGCARGSPYEPYLISRLWNSPRSGVCGYDGPLQPEPGEDLDSEEDDEENSSGTSGDEDDLSEGGSTEEEGEEEQGEEDEQQQQQAQRGAGRPRQVPAAGTTKPADGRKAAAAKPKAAGGAGAKASAKRAAGPSAKGKAAAVGSKCKAAGKQAVQPPAKKQTPAAKGKAAAGVKRQAAGAAPAARKRAK